MFLSIHCSYLISSVSTLCSLMEFPSLSSPVFASAKSILSSQLESCNTRCISTHWDPWTLQRSLGAILCRSGDFFLALTFYFPPSSNYLSLHLIVKFLEICCLPFPLSSPQYLTSSIINILIECPRASDNLPLVLTRPGSRVLYQNPGSPFLLPSSLEGWLALIPCACWFVLSSVPSTNIYWLPNVCQALET